MDAPWLRIENLGAITLMHEANLCLLFGLKNTGILRAVTKLHTQQANG
jgi:hypothetical protein